MSRKFLLIPFLVLSVVFTALLLKTFTPGNTTVSKSSVLGDSENALYIPNDYKNLGQPSGFTVLSDGSIWYLDILNVRLVHVSPSGEILRTIGRAGGEQGEFSDVVIDVAHDNDDNIYVIGETKAYKFDSNGGYITSWSETNDETIFQRADGITFDATSNTILISERDTDRILRFTVSGTFVAAYGSSGTGDGELDHPVGLTVDATGRIYVTDFGNQRVMVFNANGTYNKKFGTNGSGDGELINPTDVVVATNGDVFVVAQDIPRIVIFDSSGNWDRSWGTAGTSAWELQSPYSIDIDGSGNVWIANWGSHALQRFSQSGTFISTIRNSGNVGGRLSAPMDVAYDSIGNLYVLDNLGGGTRVQKFTNAGVYLATVVNTGILGSDPNFLFIDRTDDKMYISNQDKVSVFTTSGSALFEFGTLGSGDGEFTTASGVALDSAKNIYVADKGNKRVQKFDSSGNYITQWGSLGSGHGEFCFDSLGAIIISSTDEIYIADNCSNTYFNTRVEVYNTAGVYQRTIGSFQRDVEGKFFIIQGMAIDSLGRLQVSDYDCKIQIFDTTTGDYISKYGEKEVGSKCGSDVGELVQPHGLALNPITDRITIADTNNDRVQLIPSGTRIKNLISSADVISSDGTTSLVSSYFDPSAPGVNNLNSSMYFGGYRVSDFHVNLTTDRDWRNVNVITLPDISTSLVVNLNPTGAPGISSTHTLYVAKKVDQTSVHVCPDATSIESVTSDCDNGYTLVPGSVLSSVNIDGIDYWKVTGLTGTGVLGIDAPTPSPTTTPTSTATVTTTAAPTPTITVTATATPTVIATGIPTAIPPTTAPTVVVKGAVPVCPTFVTFTTSTTIIKKGDNVTFSWVTKNTEVVQTPFAQKALDPVGSLTVTPLESTDISFIADNGDCIAKKTVSIYVVASLPWNNTLTVGSGVLLVEAAIALQQPTLFGNIWLSLASFINRRKKRAWGYIYDSTTKKPLSRAVIRLIRKDDNSVVDTVVSEANGTFRLTPRIGKYTISVTHSGYIFPSKAVVGPSDAGFINIYLGEEINVTDPTNEMLLSIPVDPANLSEAEARGIRLRRFVDSALSVGSTLLIAGGFTYSAYTAIQYPHIYNYIILCVYLFMITAKVFMTFRIPKTQGIVTSRDGLALSGVELGIFDVDFRNLLYRTFTTAEGRYSFVVPNIDYKLKVMDEKYTLQVNGNFETDLSLSQVGTEHVRVITTDLVLSRK